MQSLVLKIARKRFNKMDKTVLWFTVWHYLAEPFELLSYSVIWTELSIHKLICVYNMRHAVRKQVFRVLNQVSHKLVWAQPLEILADKLHWKYKGCPLIICPGLGTNCVYIEKLIIMILLHEPPRWKTNNVVSEQVRHKPTCTGTEKSKKFEISDLSRRGIVLSE